MHQTPKTNFKPNHFFMKKFLLTLVGLLALFTASAGTQKFGTSSVSIPGLATASSGASNNAVKWTSEDLDVELSFVQCYNSSQYLMAVKQKAQISFTATKAIQKISITTPTTGTLAGNGTLALYINDATEYDSYKICKDNGVTYEFVPSVTAANTTYTLKNINNPENSSKNGNVQIATMTILYEGESPEIPVEPTVVKVANIAELLAANKDIASGKDSEDIFELTNPVTAVFQYKSNLYIKDNTGYMLVFGSLDQTYENGDVIPAGIKGNYSNYNGLPQLKAAKATFATGTPGTEVEPILTSVDDANAEALNSYIELKGVTIAGMAASGNFTISDPLTEATIIGRNSFAINPSNGENLTIRGFVAIFNGTYQIYPTEILNASGEEAAVAPTFNPAGGEVLAGTKVNIYTTTEGASIYYTINGDEPTTDSSLYEEAIEITEAMTIKAIAVKDGMANSSVASASYTIKVPADASFNFAAPETLTPAYPASFSDESLEDDGTTGNKQAIVSDVVFSQGNVSVSSVKGSTDAKIYYQSNGKTQLRVYQNGSTTIKSTDPENNITKIVFTYNNGTTSSSKVTAPEVGTWTAADCTWTGNAQEVTFTYTGTQQINAIEVFCAEGLTTGVDDVVADDANAPVEYYNLQGVRVENPENGLYIKRQGSTVTKVIIR